MVNKNKDENINNQPDIVSTDKKTAVFLLIMGIPFSKMVIEKLQENETAGLVDTMLSMHELSFKIFLTISKGIEKNTEWELFLKERSVFQEWYFFFRSLTTGRDGLPQVDGLKESTLHEKLRHFNDGYTPKDAAYFFEHEPPLMGAYYLTCMPNEIGFQILNELPDKRLISVSKELIQLNHLIKTISRQVQTILGSNPEYLPAIHRRLNKRPYLIEYLSCCGFSSKEELIMDLLDEYAPEAINAMWRDIMVFEDLVRINNDELRRTLAPFDLLEIAKALKTASDDLKKAIIQAQSPDIQSELNELRKKLDPIKLSEVEEIHQDIVFSYKSLTGKPTITFRRAKTGEHRNHDDIWV